jgi:hypothetical protein
MAHSKSATSHYGTTLQQFNQVENRIVLLFAVFFLLVFVRINTEVRNTFIDSNLVFCQNCFSMGAFEQNIQETQ